MDASVIIVTGGGTELGRSVTRRLVGEGHRVVVSDPDLVGGRKFVEELREQRGEAIFVAADLETEEGARELVQRAVRAYGRVDAAVNNAWACQAGVMLHECDAEFLDRTLGVSLREVFLAMRSQLRHFRDQGGGVIVNTVSTDAIGGDPAGLVPRDDLIDLTAVDVEILSRRAALDYAPDNVRVRSYAAGVVADIDSEAVRLYPTHHSATCRRAAAQHICAMLLDELQVVGANLREVDLVAG